ncbi:MAG: DUF4097 family beta strand repeat protein [Steroidobacteraceae bacterium]|nr:DUF4097 family beta strand repeat protein [Steroidobacteraceae bacterium]
MPRLAPVTASLLLAACSSSFAAGKVFDRSAAADPQGSVEVSNVAGQVRIMGWDKAEVAVHGELDDNVERIEFSSNKGRTVVKVVLPRNCGNGCGADLEIRVPKQSELRVSTVSADLQTENIIGVQRLNTVSGELTAHTAGANFDGRTVSGDLRVLGNGEPAETRVETVSGNATLQRVAGRVEATSVSGELHLEVDPAHNVRLRTTSGDVSFRGQLTGSGTLEAESVSGEVRLTTRAQEGFAYEASSFSGDLDNCFGASAQSTSAFGPGSRLSGSRGEGKARVSVKTMSGDVEICDR